MFNPICEKISEKLSAKIFWIYGRSGYGKTFFINSAIVNTNKTICPLDSDHFMEIYLKLLWNSIELDDFIFYCNKYDFLILDNIDIFIRHKSATQGVLNELICRIIKAGKTKVVIISTISPNNFQKMKFVDNDCRYIKIKKPSLQQKFSFVNNWFEQKKLTFHKKQVDFFINSTNNLFRLNGLLNFYQIKKQISAKNG